MKFKLIYTFFALCLGAFLLSSSSGGRAAAPSPEGNTGAPGDPGFNGRTCVTCHGGNGSIQVTVDLQVKDLNGATVSGYVPGETYQVEVTVNPAVGNPFAYGFQLVCEVDEDNSSTNSWSNPSSNANVVTLQGRDYAEHFQPSVSNQFSVDWTAPEAGTGDVTFYAGGNGVNLNGLTSGDGAAITSLSLTESPASSLEEIAQPTRLLAYPNPATSSIQLEVPGSVSGPEQVQIFDLSGRLQKQLTVQWENGKSALISVADLPPGAYTLTLSKQTLQGQSTIFIKE